MPTSRNSRGKTPLQIGPLRLWSPVVLAPMAGVTDAPFRRLCRLFGEEGLPSHLRPSSSWVREEESSSANGDIRDTSDPPVAVLRVDAPAGLYVTEMITSRALVEGNAKTRAMVRPDPAERVRSIQLYGVVPEVMAKATRILIEADLVDHIDLNFGCPVPKVTRKGGGAALPWKKDLFADLLSAVVRAADSQRHGRGQEIPVTVKMRIGIDDDHVTFLDAARTAQSLGVAAVALHARTQTQHYSGKAQWDQIARLKDALRIPVLGNGDIFSGADAVNMMQQTGCDAVVVGRGCQGRPWIFRDIVSAMHGLPVHEGPTLREIVQIITRHATWLYEEHGDEERAMREIRKHVGWYLRGFAVGGSARGALNKVSTMAELVERLNALDLDQPFPEAAQGPRGRAGAAKAPHLPHGWLDSPYLTEEERQLLHFAEDGADGG